MRKHRVIPVIDTIRTAGGSLIGIAILCGIGWYGYTSWQKKESMTETERLWETLEDSSLSIPAGETRTKNINPGDGFKYEFEVRCTDGEASFGVTGTRTASISVAEIAAVVTKRVTKGQTDVVPGRVESGQYKGGSVQDTFYSWVVTNTSKSAPALVRVVLRKRR